jgi:Glyoxalase-like domain
MLVGIDHLVIAVADPDAASAELEAKLGLASGGGGRHDRLGTFNRLVWLGDTYLELIGVFDRDAAASSWLGVPTLRALEAGGGLATWAIASDDLAADVAALRDRGATLAKPVEGERARADGRVVRWRLSAPEPLDRDRPPFLIEHDPGAAEWSPAERAERATGPARLAVLELGVDDPDSVSRSFLRTVGLRFRPSLSGGGARDADIDTQLVRLRPTRDRAQPRTTIHLRTRQQQSADVDALGCHWILRSDALTDPS